MKDRDFLMWLHGRLEYVHEENPIVDYMRKLRAIILATPSEQETPNVAMANNLDDVKDMLAGTEAPSPAPEAPKEEEQFPVCVGCKRDGLQRRVGLCQDCGRHVKPDYYERSETT